MVADLAAGLDGTDAVVSVCPPGSALDVAQQVADAGFVGVYVDANAIAPSTMRDVAAVISAGGADVVDGGIIGPPAWRPGTTRLALAGDRAEDVAAMFAGSNMETVLVSGAVGSASALKTAYAAWTKGSSALLLAVAAFADAEGVAEPLRAEWERSQPGLIGRLDATAVGTAPKAWRFVAEMLEISAAFADDGLPDGFHRGAAELYDAMSQFRGGTPSADEVRAALAEPR